MPGVHDDLEQQTLDADAWLKSKGGGVNPIEAIMQFLGMRGMPGTQENIDAVQQMDPRIVTNAVYQGTGPVDEATPAKHGSGNPRPPQRPASIPRANDAGPTAPPQQPQAAPQAAPQQQSPFPPQSSAETATDAGINGLNGDSFSMDPLLALLTTAGSTYGGYKLAEALGGMGGGGAPTPAPTPDDPQSRALANKADVNKIVEADRQPRAVDYEAVLGPGRYPQQQPQFPGNPQQRLSVDPSSVDGGPRQLPPPAPVDPSRPQLPPFPPPSSGIDARTPQQLWQSIPGLPQNEMGALNIGAQSRYRAMPPEMQAQFTPNIVQDVNPQHRAAIDAFMQAIRNLQ